MTDFETILEKLEEQNGRLKTIETAITTIAVQDEKIINLQSQVTGLWKKYDLYFSGNGVIPKIQQHQASCPRSQVKYMWGAIFITALSVIIKFLTG
jgi:hypothetical protein